MPRFQLRVDAERVTLTHANAEIQVSEALPADVRDLLTRHLVSMEYIETLLTLAGDETRRWTPAEIATLTHASAASAAGCLEKLVEAGFATRVRSSSAATYQYSPKDPSVRKTVSSLEEMYRTRPVTLIKAIYERPATSAVQSFADAFRVRKSDS
jgi:hypothetical protein